MSPPISPNTQAILLLTAPLIAGRGPSSPDLLTPGEYKRLARHLREIQRQPADLLSPDAGKLLRDCQSVMDETRLRRLLGRGFLLGQVMERWQARAIWVISRADTQYPRRLKVRLREDAPAILYGCGATGLLEGGGLAVAGSRHVGDALIDYAVSIGRLAALAGKALVSGGAKGTDQAAMRGALEAGGQACGVLADSLEKAAMERAYRNGLLAGQLALISPYDPSAGFNTAHAMQRNKLIYALADVALVVNSDVGKGGTWAGAIEQLDKLKCVPVHVRSTGQPSAGLDALRKKGALAWPNPNDADAFKAVFSASALPLVTSGQMGFTLDVDGSEPAEGAALAPRPPESADIACADDASTVQAGVGDGRSVQAAHAQPPVEALLELARQSAEVSPAQRLFAVVRDLVLQLLTAPMKDAEIAAALGVSTAQAKAWLERLVNEGALEKQKKPTGYVVKQKRLFE